MADRIKVRKEDDIIGWYNQVLLNSEVVDFSDIKGFAVYRPYGYEMWESSMYYLDSVFKERGVKNAYFPLLIPESLLTREKEHVKHFNPEVAWVTMGGDSLLDERLAIRPTSETIMYRSYSKWIQSYRDLPMLINQWNTMVRWETKETRFFLRGRENLWQEGHCVFATEEEAVSNAEDMIRVYKKFSEEVLAFPVLMGFKSEGEKFAGAVRTYTIEAVLPNNFASQVGTSHYLGQNFSKPFDVKFLDRGNRSQYAYQTSWGVSARAIGVMILIHGDNSGLVLPPSIAPIQAVVVPIMNGKSGESVEAYAGEVYGALKALGIKVLLDDRREYSPGWKFNEYEMKGVPIRVEVGEKEVKERKVSLKTRFNGSKDEVPFDAISTIPDRLADIQREMFERAEALMKSALTVETDRGEFVKKLKEGKYIVKAAWCGNPMCETKIGDETGAVSRMIPMTDDELLDKKCIFCGQEAEHNAYFGQSY